MSRGVNKVILIGNLGKDPESRMVGEKSVANCTIATSESWKDKATGEQKDKTEWHNLVAFEKKAELIAQYCKKGSQLYVEGKLQTRKWQDKEGKDRYTTEIVVHDFQFLGGGKQDGERSSAPAAAASGEKNFEDDDIPF